MACYLRASGAGFNVDAFLAESSLTWDPTWRRGDRRRVRRSGQPEHRADSGVAAEAGRGDELASQVVAVSEFLSANADEVARLVGFPGVEGACLDFGVYWAEDSAARFFRFPVSLLRLIASLGLELELSVYHLREPDQHPG